MKKELQENVTLQKYIEIIIDSVVRLENIVKRSMPFPGSNLPDFGRKMSSR